MFEKEDIEVLQDRYGSLLKKLVYFECDIGWFEIIENALAKILEISYEEDETIHVTQIKEKFGGLRIYYFTSIEDEDRLLRLSEVVYKAENMSYTVCEVCGDAGKPNKKGWIKTLCPEHFQQIG